MKVCLIGYGIIGAAWAVHYRQDGHELVVWNRTPRPDVPGFVADLACAAADAEVLHVVVADPPAVQSVLDGMDPVLGPGQLLLQSSTISPGASARFHARVESRGVDYVEAPFTGSKPAAEQRQNVFFIGGSAPAKARALKILQPLSRAVLDFGGHCQASAIKLALNLQIAAISQGLAEGLEFSRRAGIDDARFFEALDLNVAHSGLSDLKKAKLMASDFTPQFSVKHLHKDLRLAVESAAEGQLPLTGELCTIYQRGLEAGWGDLDFTALIRLLQAGEQKGES